MEWWSKIVVCILVVVAMTVYLFYISATSSWPVLLRRHQAETLGTVFKGFTETEIDGSLLTSEKVAQVPTVLAPGMGDSCFNPGFSQLTSMVAGRTNRFAFCYGAGSDANTDPINSFTKTMDDQVEHFAQKVKGNIELAAGFNAMGLSQGNLIIRAYSKYQYINVWCFTRVR